jgi:hypothetical protein
LGSTEVMKAKRARFPTIFHATVATRIVVHAHTCALQIVVQDLRASQVWQEIVLFSRQNINCANTKKKTAKFPSKPHKQSSHNPTKAHTYINTHDTTKWSSPVLPSTFVGCLMLPLMWSLNGRNQTSRNW